MKLAERAAACQHWRWMPGMRIRGIDKLCVEVTANKGCPIYRNGYGNLSPVPHAEPDLTDPATLGCLLALVREALDDSRIHCRARANVFRVYSGVTPVGEWANSEAEALVAALEAATG